MKSLNIKSITHLLTSLWYLKGILIYPFYSNRLYFWIYSSYDEERFEERNEAKARKGPSPCPKEGFYQCVY